VTAEPALSPQAEKQAEKAGNMPAAYMCFSACGSPCPAGSPNVSQSWRNGSFAPIMINFRMESSAYCTH